MSIRNIRWPDEHDVILNHIRLAHNLTDDDPLLVWYGAAPDFDPANCFVIADENDQIVAHAMLVPRQLQIGLSQLPTAEIAVMGVQEAYRGRGYAHTLLDALHQRATERGDVLGLIFGIPNFYEQWQYEYAVGLYLTSFESGISTELALKAGRWNIEHSYERRTSDRLGARNRPVVIRRFGLDDLPRVQALYAEESARGHYMIARNQATWEWQLDFLTRVGRYEPDDFMVAEVDNTLAAYVRLVTQTPANWFRGHEAARFSVIEAAGDHPDAVEVLLGECARVAQAFNVDRIGVFAHPQSQFMAHVLAHGGTLSAFTGAGFLRLHDLEQTMRLLTPTLEDRRLNSRYMSRAYQLVITTEREQVEITLGMGSAELVELEVHSTALARLITGWYGIDHLPTGYQERHRDLLRVLFPLRDPKIGLADLV